MDVIIRDVRKDDIVSAADIKVKCWQSAYRGKVKGLDSISPQITYGVFDDGCLLGVFSLRLELVGCLINHGGNIGYFIRPSKRNMGYGTKVLRCAMDEALKLWS